LVDNVVRISFVRRHLFLRLSARNAGDGAVKAEERRNCARARPVACH
jgi:hypothetical protein